MYINGDGIEVINYIETHPILYFLCFLVIEVGMDGKYSKTKSIKSTCDYGGTKRLSKGLSLKYFIDSFFILPLTLSLPLKMEDIILNCALSFFDTFFLGENILEKGWPRCLSFTFPTPKLIKELCDTAITKLLPFLFFKFMQTNFFSTCLKIRGKTNIK